MAQLIGIKRWLLPAGVLVLAGMLLVPATAPAQEEVTSAIRRYKQYEVSTGYYEQYEARPRHQRPLVGIPGVSRGLFPYSPTSATVRSRTHLADSHRGIKFYWGRRCEDCHINETHDIHTTRANLTCRQCHGGEPIASIDHYYSPMNPIRKHAYICAKCHEGASASYASYIVHEPAAGSSIARTTFPILYYTYWFMLVLLVGTLAFFIPHSFLVGLRELFKNKRKTKNADTNAH
jgi:hypothetical protein